MNDLLYYLITVVSLIGVTGLWWYIIFKDIEYKKFKYVAIATILWLIVLLVWTYLKIRALS